MKFRVFDRIMDLFADIFVEFDILWFVYVGFRIVCEQLQEFQSLRWLDLFGVDRIEFHTTELMKKWKIRG